MREKTARATVILSEEALEELEIISDTFSVSKSRVVSEAIKILYSLLSSLNQEILRKIEERGNENNILVACIDAYHSLREKGPQILDLVWSSLLSVMFGGKLPFDKMVEAISRNESSKACNSDRQEAFQAEVVREAL